MQCNECERTGVDHEPLDRRPPDRGPGARAPPAGLQEPSCSVHPGSQAPLATARSNPGDRAGAGPRRPLSGRPRARGPHQRLPAGRLGSSLLIVPPSLGAGSTSAASEILVSAPAVEPRDPFPVLIARARTWEIGVNSVGNGCADAPGRRGLVGSPHWALDIIGCSASTIPHRGCVPPTVIVYA